MYHFLAAASQCAPKERASSFSAKGQMRLMRSEKEEAAGGADGLRAGAGAPMRIGHCGAQWPGWPHLKQEPRPPPPRPPPPRPRPYIAVGEEAPQCDWEGEARERRELPMTDSLKGPVLIFAS